jgi:hypothetical protein
MSSDAKFRYKPVPDIMAVVSGYKDWEIRCAKIQEELGWTPTYMMDDMVNDIMDIVRPQSR